MNITKLYNRLSKKIRPSAIAQPSEEEVIKRIPPERWDHIAQQHAEIMYILEGKRNQKIATFILNLPKKVVKETPDEELRDMFLKKYPQYEIKTD